MKITKNTKIVMITAYGEAYYSGSVAYGRFYMPLDAYEKYQENIDEVRVFAFELDGKHSEMELDIDFEHMTVGDILLNGHEDVDCNADYSDCLCESIEDALYEDISEPYRKRLVNFDLEMHRLSPLKKTVTKKVTLPVDITVGEDVIKKETEVAISYEKTTSDIDFWSMEIDLSE